jgi:hypothetical protein
MKPTASKRKNGGQTASNVISIGGTYPESKSRLDHIAVAAYFKAEGRCFAAGRELDDWQAAEAEFERAQEE